MGVLNRGGINTQSHDYTDSLINSIVMLKKKNEKGQNASFETVWRTKLF